MSVRPDADFWSARMGFLGKLARADAIAVILEVKTEGFVTYAADNVPSDPGWNGAVAGPLIRSTLDTRRPGQASVVLPLADGRATGSRRFLAEARNAFLCGVGSTRLLTTGLDRVHNRLRH